MPSLLGLILDAKSTTARTMPPAPALQPLDESLFFKLIRVVNVAARPFHERTGRAHDLTLPEWRVMAVVGSRPRVTASDVGYRSGMDKMSVSRAVARLERHGRLERLPGETDRRTYALRLTRSGRALFEQLAGAARARESVLFGGLRVADLQRLDATLEHMIRMLLDESAGAAPGRPAAAALRSRRG